MIFLNDNIYLNCDVLSMKKELNRLRLKCKVKGKVYFSPSKKKIYNYDIVDQRLNQIIVTEEKKSWMSVSILYDYSDFFLVRLYKLHYIRLYYKSRKTFYVILILVSSFKLKSTIENKRPVNYANLTTKFIIKHFFFFKF